MTSTISIVVPAHNEESMIKEVMHDLRSFGYENIIVVDDGSRDKTRQVARDQGATVLHHIINRGQGAALRTGMDYALEEGADIIITFDADGQHQAKDLERLTAPIIRGRADIVLGSRFLRRSAQVSLLKRIYLKVGVLVLFLMYGIRLTDSHNGLRAFSRKAAQKIRIVSDGMEHASEIPEKIRKNHLRYVEVPVDIRYTDYSRQHGQKYITNAFNIFFKMIWNKFMR